MNKRLVWNFEIYNTLPLDVASMPLYAREEWHSEQRFFWEEDSVITLAGLSDDFLNLAAYKIKERQDRYFVLPEHDFNIKERQGELLFKPRARQSTGHQAFLKKCHLADYPPDALLPGIHPIESAKLLHLIATTAFSVTLKKTALIYKFPTTPGCKLELARLRIMDSTLDKKSLDRDKIYFSACIEGHSAHLVTAISTHLLPNATAFDYVTFLKKIAGHPHA